MCRTQKREREKWRREKKNMSPGPGCHFRQRGGACRSGGDATEMAPRAFVSSFVVRSTSLRSLEDMIILAHQGFCNACASCSWHLCTAYCPGTRGRQGMGSYCSSRSWSWPRWTAIHPQGLLLEVAGLQRAAEFRSGHIRPILHQTDPASVLVAQVERDSSAAYATLSPGWCANLGSCCTLCYLPIISCT